MYSEASATNLVLNVWIVSSDSPLISFKGSAPSEKYFGYPGKEEHKYQVGHSFNNSKIINTMKINFNHFNQTDPYYIIIIFF